MKTGPDTACISTGNFHEGNARMYTDCMLMTANSRLVREVNQVLSSAPSPIKFLKKLLVSPNEIKKKFVRPRTTRLKTKPENLLIEMKSITLPTQ